jgi:hypothetical protein
MTRGERRYYSHEISLLILRRASPLLNILEFDFSGSQTVLPQIENHAEAKRRFWAHEGDSHTRAVRRVDEDDDQLFFYSLFSVGYTPPIYALFVSLLQGKFFIQ